MEAKARMVANSGKLSFQLRNDGNWEDKIYYDALSGTYKISGDLFAVRVMAENCGFTVLNAAGDEALASDVAGDLTARDLTMIGGSIALADAGRSDLAARFGVLAEGTSHGIRVYSDGYRVDTAAGACIDALISEGEASLLLCGAGAATASVRCTSANAGASWSELGKGGLTISDGSSTVTLTYKSLAALLALI